MPVKEKNEEPAAEAELTTREPGFYVEHDGHATGPFLTQEDADAFVTGHCEAAGVKAKVVETAAE